MPAKRVALFCLSGLFVCGATLWNTTLRSSEAVVIDFGSFCFNMMSVDGQDWIADDAIPSEWTGPVAGTFTQRFGQGRFEADDITVSYSRTTAAGPCISRTIN